MQCAQQGEVEEAETETGQSSSAVFVGETACLSCHPEAYLDWENSHHDWAMKPANDETVLGELDLADVQLDGVRYKFYKKENEFLVEVDDLESDPEVYTIAYTFGVEPLQQYLVEFPGGRMQALRATWDTEQEIWFHQYSGQEIPEHDWMHWTRGAQNWNTMCADCHSTNLQSGYDWESDTYHSTWSSINVSCEACHGPGSRHLKWAEEAAEEDTDPYIQSVEGQTAQINTCGPCHARRTKLLDSITIGADFHEQYEIQTLSPEFYHPDGQIREEDYVLGSFLSSRMYLEGVMCTDCHNPHSNELILTGNALCMQCHEPEYDSEAHHFHPIGTEGAECINCHMTG
jgi:predicted CXXCH cytochrome family protein